MTIDPANKLAKCDRHVAIEDMHQLVVDAAEMPAHWKTREAQSQILTKRFLFIFEKRKMFFILKQTNIMPLSGVAALPLPLPKSPTGATSAMQ